MFSKRNIETKIEAIKLYNLGKTPLELAKKFGVHRNTIYRWIAKRQQVEETKTIFGSNSARRKHASFRIPYPELDEALLEWFQETQAREGYIQVETIQDNAIRIAREYGIEDFKASRSWVRNFKIRNKLTRKLISGEERSCPQDEVFQFQTRLINICAGYHPRDIFNLDETSLFFRASPTRSIARIGAPNKGYKNFKDKITIILNVNAAGEKEQLFVVGKLVGRNLNNLVTSRIRYRRQVNGWMNQQLFREYLNDFNEKMVSQNRHVLLFIDNAPQHSYELDFYYSNIRIRRFPPNTTAKTQPLDLCVINSFKSKYRKLIRDKIESNRRNHIPIDEAFNSIRMQHGIWYAYRAYLEISPETIQAGFRKAGFAV